MRLKELRKQAHKTQEEIAKAINTARVTYTRYENGLSEPSIDTLCRLADYYRVSLDYLVGRDFVSDLGYIDELEKKLIQTYRQMSEPDQIRFLLHGEGFLISQKK